MDPTQADKNDKKEAMKKLRRSRSEWIKKASAAVKSQKKLLKSIKEQLAKGAGTIPEIADATGIPSHEVLWLMAALKKYGQIVEAEKDGGYFRYALTENTDHKES
jgi:DNA invertase Pin-like site-specific DNA recombinase